MKEKSIRGGMIRVVRKKRIDNGGAIGGRRTPMGIVRKALIPKGGYGMGWGKDKMRHKNRL